MITSSGFKLDRFEVYNWGTFDGRIWVIDPQCHGTLLTGENGSGKSTLVDGLLTLLVSNQKRNYNLASGSEKKERSELTYVRGAFGREQNELGFGQIKYLREDNNYSVLLARFKHETAADSITLGQFFWFNQGALKKIYFATQADVTIDKHFAQIENPAEFKNRLKKIEQTSVFNTFSEYQTHFMKHLRFRSEKGLDLFNQITTIKEINRLNEFVRKHMLNAGDANELLDSLYKNYENLSISYQAIVLAKNQLEELTPLLEDATKNQKLVQKLEDAHQQKKAIPQFFSEHKKQALEKRLLEHERKLIETEHFLIQSTQQVKTLGEHKIQLSNLLTNDKSGQEIERLQLALKVLSEKSTLKTQSAKRYQDLAQKLNFSAKPTVQTFAETLEKIKTKRTQIESQVLVLQEEQYQNKKTSEELSAHLQERLLEVQSLKLRDSRVPSQHIKVRDELAKALAVSPKTLPFVAELLKVSDTEEMWAGAIEKLLHPFALRMLVPNDLYGSLIKYLSGKHIGLKLVFQNIEVSAYTKPLSTSKIGPEQLFHKLEFLKTSPYLYWLQEQIAQRYDYDCTEDLLAFKKRPKAITSEGLMRHGLYLGEKDDRFAVRDKSRFILGWDNQEKLDYVYKQIQNCQTQLDQTLKQNSQVIHALQSSQNDLEALRDLEQFQDYNSIDTQSMALEIEDLKKRQTSLMTSSGSVTKLKKELELLEQELEIAQHQRDTALKENAVTTESIQMLQNEKKRLPQATEILTPLVTEWINQTLKKQKRSLAELELGDYALIERSLADELEKTIQKAQQECQTLEHALVRKMAHFKTRFSEQSVDLDPTLEGLSEFLELKKILDIESLPEHERRFKRLLNKSLLNDMAAFKSTLDIGYEQIDETIEQLNQSLREISYSPTTYVELHAMRNKDIEIREFHHLLRVCLNDLQSASEQQADLEVMFDRIKSLLDRLKNEERWCKKVTDVRNWADFSVEEKTQGTHEAKNFYSDSQGLSGGQKAKLAFTILASAIAHQYGTQQEGSFRFIVVDEAFSKSDEKNSRYAMELFQNLGLQVMVVTPKDKVHVVEPFIRSMFVTQMATNQDRSQVLSARMP